MTPSATGTPVLGLDLGGTKIAAALFAADGTVLARLTRPTPALDGAAAVLEHAAAATERDWDWYEGLAGAVRDRHTP
ncbi:hypothetical protein ABZV68_27590, partial [Streptomyces clavifer]